MGSFFGRHPPSPLGDFSITHGSDSPQLAAGKFIGLDTVTEAPKGCE